MFLQNYKYIYLKMSSPIKWIYGGQSPFYEIIDKACLFVIIR